MSNYKFEPTYCEENGFWYCRKLVYMSLPIDHGEFETEGLCKLVCNCLNSIENDLKYLSNFNINLRLTEVKRD